MSDIFSYNTDPPKTEWIRFIFSLDGDSDGSTEGWRRYQEDRFDRWLADRDAQVWDAAIEKVMETDVIRIPDNPYRSNDE